MPATTLSQPRKPLRILLVEDSPTQRLIISRMLNQLGHQVIPAVDGVEGVTRTYQHQPDLILMDLDMPYLGGFDAARILQRDRKTAPIPVIILSATDSRKARLRAQMRGARGYLPKPLDPLHLQTTVERLFPT
jgi:twitching motility two-component system response regulator PilH